MENGDMPKMVTRHMRVVTAMDDSVSTPRPGLIDLYRIDLHQIDPERTVALSGSVLYHALVRVRHEATVAAEPCARFLEEPDRRPSTAEPLEPL